MFIASTNVSGLQKQLDAAQQKLPAEIFRALEQAVERASVYAKTSTLYRSRTYGLRNSVTWGAQRGSNVMSAVMTASAPYAGFVERGTRPHIIEARKAKSLRFIQNGAVRFARAVHHPGTKPRPFMAQAQEQSLPLLERLMAEAIARAYT